MSHEIDSETLQAMQERSRPGTTWVAYRNVALDSANAGHLQFLMVGDGCTHAEAPQQYHDTPHGPGWRYKPIGTVVLDTGVILPYGLG